MDDNTSQLTTNDMLLDLANQAEADAEEQKEFTQKYEDFLEQIRKEDADFDGTTE
jgi:hypothetical protein